MKRQWALATRAFLLSVMVIAPAMLGSFLAVNTAIKRQVRAELRRSLRAQEAALEQNRAAHDLQVRRLAGVLSDSVGLKAGLGLLREAPESDSPRHHALIRRTLEEQLRALAEQLGYDFVAVADPEDRPVAAVATGNGVMTAVDPSAVPSEVAALWQWRGSVYETMRAPVNRGAENLGSLVLGRRLDLGTEGGGGKVAMLRGSTIIASNLEGDARTEFEKRLSACGGRLDDCEVELAGETHLVMPIRRATAEGDLALAGLRSLDAATSAFTQDFGAIFLVIGAGCLGLAMIFAAAASRSIAGPIQDLAERLVESERTGELPNNFPADSTAREVNHLANALNRASDAVGESRRTLDRAYLEFIETMAQALDARDPCTAGHSDRVGRCAVAIAQACGCTEAEIETIRIGARLHDIGKIGVPDAVLQKPGRLTRDEFDLIKQHTVIGRRILERVGRFREYLPIVELHHEDHDGGGYPYGLQGEDIPLAARIVHVADVYDALSSNRAYRQRMPERRVREILRLGAGRQFDPRVVDTFLDVLSREDTEREVTDGLLSLIGQTGIREMTVDEEIHVEIRKSA